MWILHVPHFFTEDSGELNHDHVQRALFSGTPLLAGVAAFWAPSQPNNGVLGLQLVRWGRSRRVPLAALAEESLTHPGILLTDQCNAIGTGQHAEARSRVGDLIIEGNYAELCEPLLGRFSFQLAGALPGSKPQYEHKSRVLPAACWILSLCSVPDFPQPRFVQAIAFKPHENLRVYRIAAPQPQEGHLPIGLFCSLSGCSRSAS